MDIKRFIRTKDGLVLDIPNVSIETYFEGRDYISFINGHPVDSSMIVASSDNIEDVLIEGDAIVIDGNSYTIRRHISSNHNLWFETISIEKEGGKTILRYYPHDIDYSILEEATMLENNLDGQSFVYAIKENGKWVPLKKSIDAMMNMEMAKR